MANRCETERQASEKCPPSRGAVSERSEMTEG